jgi:co-chaperonin GroES (HSP10)
MTEINITPTKNKIIIEMVAATDVTKGGVILKDEKRKQSIGTVLKVGSNITHAKEGDKLLLKQGEFQLLKNMGKDIAATEEHHILGYVLDDETIKPLKNKILIRLDTVEESTSKFITLDKPKNNSLATVLAIGNEITLVDVGDRVMTAPGEFQLLKGFGEDNLAITNEEFILGIFE